MPNPEVALEPRAIPKPGTTPEPTSPAGRGALRTPRRANSRACLPRRARKRSHSSARAPERSGSRRLPATGRRRTPRAATLRSRHTAAAISPKTEGPSKTRSDRGNCERWRRRTHSNSGSTSRGWTPWSSRGGRARTPLSPSRSDERAARANPASPCSSGGTTRWTSTSSRIPRRSHSRRRRRTSSTRPIRTSSSPTSAPQRPNSLSQSPTPRSSGLTARPSSTNSRPTACCGGAQTAGFGTLRWGQTPTTWSASAARAARCPSSTANPASCSEQWILLVRTQPSFPARSISTKACLTWSRASTKTPPSSIAIATRKSEPMRHNRRRCTSWTSKSLRMRISGSGPAERFS